MTYSIIGILAAVILIINNRDVFFKSGDLTDIQKQYRLFLLGVMAYYVTDLLWGLLEEAGLTGVLYADTVVHFAAMVAAVMLWTQYVITYLHGGSTVEKILFYAGRVFFCGGYHRADRQFFHAHLFLVRRGRRISRGRDAVCDAGRANERNDRIRFVFRSGL